MTFRELSPEEFPPLLSEINDPPERLFISGEMPREDNRYLTVVGSRAYTPYGKEACETLIKGLSGYPITIISGLAFGVDSIAHRAALWVGLQTIAVPGSGLDERVLYPRSNVGLAREIVAAGGGLLSEFLPTQGAALWTFPQRNRIMAGLSHAVLIVESKEKSGTLITARLATEYNRELLIVPGSIFSPQSRGCHQFLRLGALAITSSEELLDALGFEIKQKKEERVAKIPEDCSEEERALLTILENPTDRDEITRQMKLPTPKVNAIISLLEIRGLIKESGGTISRF